MNDGRSRLEDECDRLATENTRLRALAKGQEQEIVALMDNTAELEGLKAENERLSLENQDLRHKIRAVGFPPESTIEEIEEVQRLLRKMVGREKAEIQQLAAENKQLKTEIDGYVELEIKFIELEEEIDRLASKLEGWRQERKNG